MRQHPRSRFLKHRRQCVEFLIGPRPRKLAFSPQDPAIYAQILQNAAAPASGVTLNLADRTAEIDGKPVELPVKEFDLLQLLMENQGKALKKEYLFNTVWGSDSNSELQTLHVHINQLRQKLGDDPKNAKRLITVWGVGYKFV